jgi:hypothetical protein
MEEIGKHPNAALLDFGSARIFGVIDEVTVQILRDNPLRLWLHPGSHERGQVARRIALEDQIFRY